MLPSLLVGSWWRPLRFCPCQRLCRIEVSLWQPWTPLRSQAAVVCVYVHMVRCASVTTDHRVVTDECVRFLFVGSQFDCASVISWIRYLYDHAVKRVLCLIDALYQFPVRCVCGVSLRQQFVERFVLLFDDEVSILLIECRCCLGCAVIKLLLQCSDFGVSAYSVRWGIGCFCA